LCPLDGRKSTLKADTILPALSIVHVLYIRQSVCWHIWKLFFIW